MIRFAFLATIAAAIIAYVLAYEAPPKTAQPMSTFPQAALVKQPSPPAPAAAKQREAEEEKIKPAKTRGPAPTEFRGIKWGAAPTKSLKSVGGGVVWTTRNQNGLPPYLGIAVAQDAYLFDNNKLYGGQLFFNGADNLDKLKAVLIEQFGRPDFMNEARQIFKWKWASSGLEATLYHKSNFQRTTLSFQKN